MSKVSDDVARWLADRAGLVPLQAVHASKADSPGALLNQNPSLQGTIVAAMLWLRVGEIDAAHVIVQEGRNDVERYAHGIVHRLEGDYWNANYWFRQVRESSLLQTIGQSVEDAMASIIGTEFDGLRTVVRNQAFRPQDFVELVHDFLQSGSAERNPDHERQIAAIGQAEWEGVWQFIHR
jgi:hypothetical protein